MKGPSIERLVIVGASHSAVALATAARQEGFDGRIVMLGEESLPPYQRPPLSKSYLKKAAGRLDLRPPEFYDEQGIDLWTGECATAIDPSARRVSLRSGSTLEYTWLALTTGASSRVLEVPGAQHCGVLTLRTLDDAQCLATVAEAAHRICVVGAGFVGLELAASLRDLGKDVVVVEAAARILTRSVPAPVADYVARLHESHGVHILVNCAVQAMARTGSIVTVELTSGARLDCDVVIAGVGARPRTELAASAGIVLDNGIAVDGDGRTSAPQILAAGDCASFPHPYRGGAPSRVRPESIHAAQETARAAAATLVGRQRPSSGAPWFWSDQYDVKLQITGFTGGSDHYVMRGSPDSGRFTIFGLHSGRIREAHSINQPGDHILSRTLVAEGAIIAPQLLSNPAVNLRQFTAGAARPSG